MYSVEETKNQVSNNVFYKEDQRPMKYVRVVSTWKWVGMHYGDMCAWLSIFIAFDKGIIKDQLRFPWACIQTFAFTKIQEQSLVPAFYCNGHKRLFF